MICMYSWYKDNKEIHRRVSDDAIVVKCGLRDTKVTYTLHNCIFLMYYTVFYPRDTMRCRSVRPPVSVTSRSCVKTNERIEMVGVWHGGFFDLSDTCSNEIVRKFKIRTKIMIQHDTRFYFNVRSKSWHVSLIYRTEPTSKNGKQKK